MTVTSIRIDDDLAQSLEDAAADLNRPKGWVINVALRQYLQQRQLERQRWLDTLEALEDIRMGRVVDGDKVHAWIDSWGSEQELSSPLKS